jgi:hypothetical protein
MTLQEQTIMRAADPAFSEPVAASLAEPGTSASLETLKSS